MSVLDASLRMSRRRKVSSNATRLSGISTGSSEATSTRSCFGEAPDKIGGGDGGGCDGGVRWYCGEREAREAAPGDDEETLKRLDAIADNECTTELLLLYLPIEPLRDDVNESPVSVFVAA